MNGLFKTANDVNKRFDFPLWQAGEYYFVNDIVISSPFNGHAYRCIKAGASYSEFPSWSLRIGGVTTEQGDGVKWLTVSHAYGHFNKSGSFLQKEISIAKGAGVIRAGEILSLNTATYKWTYWGASDQYEENRARAVLVHSVDATDREQRAIAYFAGKYDFSKVYFRDGVSRAQKARALGELADRGIIIDVDFYATVTTTTSTTTTTTTTSSTTTTTTP